MIKSLSVLSLVAAASLCIATEVSAKPPGLSFNGRSLNGISPNGRNLNGMSVNGRNLNGSVRKGDAVGQDIQAVTVILKDGSRVTLK